MIREDGRIALQTTKGNQIFNRRPKAKIHYRNMKDEKLYPEVKRILSLYWEQDIKGTAVENVAFELRVKPGKIYKMFMRLNREGILSQAKRSYAHDTNRNRMFYGWASGWASNYYEILKSPQE